MDATGDGDSLRPTLFIIVMLRPLVSSVAPAPPRPPFPSSYLEKPSPHRKSPKNPFSSSSSSSCPCSRCGHSCLAARRRWLCTRCPQLTESLTHRSCSVRAAALAWRDTPRELHIDDSQSHTFSTYFASLLFVFFGYRKKLTKH